MGSFFLPGDDPLNQRIVLTRLTSRTIDAIWLDTDPSGAGVTPFDMPTFMAKTSLGDTANGAGFYIAYKDGVLFAFDTDLPAAHTITEGTPENVTVAVKGGTAPYSYAWTKNGLPLSVVEATIHFTADLADAGNYAVTVMDANGLVIKSTTMVLTVTPADTGE